MQPPESVSIEGPDIVNSLDIGQREMHPIAIFPFAGLETISRT
jgi:hypothetical protein